MKLSDIKKRPTVIDKRALNQDIILESDFRASHILHYVMEMLRRNDSRETINEVVDLLMEKPSVVQVDKDNPSGIVKIPAND